MATPVYATMVPGPEDAIQRLLVKTAYYLQSAAEAIGGSLSMAFYPTMAPGPNDSLQVLTAKIAYWSEQIAANGGGGGGGNTNPVYTGASPPAAPAFPLQGALYAPDDTTLPLQIWVPGTGWTVR